jgi:hypothetical protein
MKHALALHIKHETTNEVLNIETSKMETINCTERMFKIDTYSILHGVRQGERIGAYTNFYCTL